MIKGVAKSRRNTPVVILGLSAENMRRLLAKKPVTVRLRELHPELPDIEILLLGGATEAEIADDLRALGRARHGDPARTKL